MFVLDVKIMWTFFYRCGGDGQMKCDPKACSPEPMLRQMMAVAASRRRR